MGGSVNKCILVGNLCADPETRRFQGGGMVVNLRLATSESWRDKSTGERKERAEFHRVSIFNEGLCKVAEQYLHKGDKIYVEGQLENRKWQDKDGKDCYSTEVTLRPFRGSLTMLQTKRNGSGGEDRRDFGGDSGGGEQQRQPEQRSTNRDDMDDEIPF